MKPLSTELQELLAVERDRREHVSAQRQRVRARVMAAAAVMPVGAAAAAAGNSGAVVAASPWYTKPLVVALASAITGGALGATVTVAVLSRQRPASAPPIPTSPVPVQRPAPQPIVTPIPIVDAGAPRVQPSPPAPDAMRRRTPSGAQVRQVRPDPRSRSTLGAERMLLDRARAALIRNRPADALLALREHKRRFPHGVMTEERNALMVQALHLSARGH